MNEINYKPYITNNTSVKTSSRNETTGSIGFKRANNANSKEYVSSEASSASRAYGLSYIN